MEDREKPAQTEDSQESSSVNDTVESSFSQSLVPLPQTKATAKSRNHQMLMPSRLKLKRKNITLFSLSSIWMELLHWRGEPICSTTKRRGFPRIMAIDIPNRCNPRSAGLGYGQVSDTGKLCKKSVCLLSFVCPSVPGKASKQIIFQLKIHAR